MSNIKMKGAVHNGMSLFQDLKLKRRKVDSRCSSDGESIGTSDSTSSLSPDNPQNEGSPKDKERCLTPEEMVPQPNGVQKHSSFPSQFFFMMKHTTKNGHHLPPPVPASKQNGHHGGGHGENKPNGEHHKLNGGLNGVIKQLTNNNNNNTNGITTNNTSTNGLLNNISMIVKTEPKEENNNISIKKVGGLVNGISEKLSNGFSTSSSGGSIDDKASPKSNGVSSPASAASSPSSMSESGSPIGIKVEKMDVDIVSENSNNSNKTIISSKSSDKMDVDSRSPPGSDGDQADSDRENHVNNVNMSPPSLSRPVSTSSASASASNSPPSGPRLESTLIITKSNSSSKDGQLLNGHRRTPSLSPPQLNHLHARLTSGPPSQNSNGSSSLPHQMSHQNQHHNHNHHHHQQMMMDQNHHYNNNHITIPGVGGGGPLGIKQDPASLSFHHHNNHHPSSLYNNLNRINGVRPEIISGGAVQIPTSNGSSNSSNGTLSTGSRKSPTLSNQSRSPNSSPRSNSSSHSSTGTGSMHSPNNGGTRDTIVAGGTIGLVNNTSNGSLNKTPTVIMGEAGGVRTMLWSQPGQALPNSNSPTGGNDINGMSLLPPNGLTNGHGGSPLNGYANHHLTNGHHTTGPGGMTLQKGSLSMERLWASEALNLSTQQQQQQQSGPQSNSSMVNGGGSNSSSGPGSINGSSPQMPITNGHGPNGAGGGEDDEYEQPMICMICEDRATGLHYGIITCEGCKGFFKRTVQNRRVYTCVADGTCEITKAQRNRCQYCRFKKCIEQGMVLQAVREDRMPGGRNSGAVYSMYKVPVKYRKHKKGNRVGAGGGKNANGSNNNTTSNNNNTIMGSPQSPPKPRNSPPASHHMGSITGGIGNILKAALTSPSEVTHLRQSIPFDTAATMISQLIQCDNFHDIAALQNWEELLEAKGELSDKLCQMGDSIVYRLVQWTKRLPFYQEVPVGVHTQVLTHKWHELLVLTTSAWQAMHTPGPPAHFTAEEETMENLQVLQRCLQAMMGRSLTLEQLRQDVGQMVERLTFLTRAFRRLGIRLEEYVTLKVIAMLQNTGSRNEVGVIQDRYVKCLRTYLEVTAPNQPNRLSDLLSTLPEVQAAASLLLESKMFYVPFLLNSALLQR